ncbi:hypothetical protein M409DRAFT_58347 [Zasmidium cellare ATCC 36951]|uniref:Uncharacterized protein n=1 Tax=Zasmidium cellare ATCC 36951 TaxID=1080233 RepID=A0A6A6C999_ZASCE|nr:uncharacterized protein M409DRAFT_58347 [Zasmidium cellare ATCC 36951]KAF2162229.1 hypothetical protein M409DRAFT_58347 [Zasmidium cellare ATCC 36951]
MLQRSCWKWHARLSISTTRLSFPWTNAQCRRLASSGHDSTSETDEPFDEHEYYEAAEDVEHKLSAGPRRRNITSMGTVSVQQPDSSKVEDLMTRILPQNIGKASLPNTLPSILLLLVTPALAQHALSGDLPLRVLERFGDNPTASKPLDAVTAVVDRLPVPGSSRKAEEGLAYHFTTSPGPLSTFTQVPLQSSTQKPGALTFAFPRMPRFAHSEPSVQLPLAQTIFSTGLPSTMVHMRYEFDPLSGLLRKSASQRLEAQTVRVPIGAQDLQLLMETPLVPLTPLRRVVNSMGNIVRKVSSETYGEEHKSKHQEWPPQDDSTASQPASQELEAAVTEYFKLNDRQPEPVQVWALVVPRETFRQFTFTVKNPKNGLKNRSEFLKFSQSQLQDTWVPRETIGGARKVVSGGTINYELSKLVGLGARLCQVLSGGGGWGKKAGLISLDPDTMYSTRDLRADSGWTFDFDGDGAGDSFSEQQQQALGDIVREGDGVMLFLAPEHLKHGIAPQREDFGPDHRSITFGVLPSSIDEIHNGSVNDSAAGIEESARHHPNTFGLLSEGGMALTLTRDGETVNQTRLSVPFQQLVVSNVDAMPDEGAASPSRGDKTAASATAPLSTHSSIIQSKSEAKSNSSDRHADLDKPQVAKEEKQFRKVKLFQKDNRSYKSQLLNHVLEQKQTDIVFPRSVQGRSDNATEREDTDFVFPRSTQGHSKDARFSKEET